MAALPPPCCSAPPNAATGPKSTCAIKAGAAKDVGLRTSAATAIAVQCESLKQTWRVDGNWSPWTTPAQGSIGQRIVLDLCSNTLEGPAVPVAPLP